MEITPLGKVAVGAGTTAISALTQHVNKLSIQASSDNVTALYVGTSTLNRTTLVGVIAILQPGDTWGAGDEINGNAIDLTKLFIAGATATDWAIITTYTR